MKINEKRKLYEECKRQEGTGKTMFMQSTPEK